jgi:hypothetical protein
MNKEALDAGPMSDITVLWEMEWNGLDLVNGAQDKFK